MHIYKNHIYSILGVGQTLGQISLAIHINGKCFKFNFHFIDDSPQHWFGLWSLTPLSTIFQLYRGDGLLAEETGVPRENRRLVASH